LENATIGSTCTICGTICGGNISDVSLIGTLNNNAGTICGGMICGGMIWDGTICGGTIWGGTIFGGLISGGTISDATLGSRVFYSETTFLTQISGDQLIFVKQ
jgi:hypothetical protein